jgi:hypothetical protein
MRIVVYFLAVGLPVPQGELVAQVVPAQELVGEDTRGLTADAEFILELAAAAWALGRVPAGKPRVQEPERPRVQEPERPRDLQPERPRDLQPERPRDLQPERPRDLQPERPRVQELERPHVQE